jgi:hypothetical protein
MEFEKPIHDIIYQMRESGKYRSLLWAGGFKNQKLHKHSDVDLYAIAPQDLPQHWLMERIAGRRVELTVYGLETWQGILCRPYRMPKHHFTFANGTVLFDPEGLCPILGETARSVLASWPPLSTEERSSLRCGLAIQHDKTLGYRQKRLPMHARYHAIGLIHLVLDLLVRQWDGYAVDGGKNLTRVLKAPECPNDVKSLVRKLLSSPETDEMVDAAVQLCQRTFELTGGPVNENNGGIPR